MGQSVHLSRLVSDFSRGRLELIDEGDLSLAAVGQPLVFQVRIPTMSPGHSEIMSLAVPT
jgi:hypothetical protein